MRGPGQTLRDVRSVRRSAALPSVVVLLALEAAKVAEVIGSFAEEQANTKASRKGRILKAILQNYSIIREPVRDIRDVKIQFQL